jgi:hypothetical protein
MKIIVLVAIGIAVVVVVLVISLCRAAQWSDDAMDAAWARELAQPPPAKQTLRTLDLSHAAALLGVSPQTLLAWEERYGFPTSSASDHRYNRSEVLALRDSIADGMSITAAVARARQRSKRRPAPAHAWANDRRGGGLAS